MYFITDIEKRLLASIPESSLGSSRMVSTDKKTRRSPPVGRYTRADGLPLSNKQQSLPVYVKQFQYDSKYIHTTSQAN